MWSEPSPVASSAHGATVPPPRRVELRPENNPRQLRGRHQDLFRPQYQQSTSVAFDPWSYDDVSAHADTLTIRLQAGTVPSDGPWPPPRSRCSNAGSTPETRRLSQASGDLRRRPTVAPFRSEEVAFR
jgi:hypothetical protein